MDNLGQLLKQLKADRQLTQTDAAEKAGIE